MFWTFMKTWDNGPASFQRGGFGAKCNTIFRPGPGLLMKMLI